MALLPAVLLLCVGIIATGVRALPPHLPGSPPIKPALSDPEPCCIPTSHGNVSMLFGSLNGGSPTAFSSMASVAFDQENYKAAAHHVVPNPDDPSATVSIYVDYTEGTMYIAQAKTKQCSTQQLPVGMMGTCIPDDDYLYLGQGQLGLGAAVTPVDMWQIDGNEAGIDMMFQAWTTPKQCGFVQMNMWGNTGDAQIIASLGFFNMTIGIKDKSVFDVPSYCNDASKDGGLNGSVRGERVEEASSIKLTPLMRALKYKFSVMNKVQAARPGKL